MCDLGDECCAVVASSWVRSRRERRCCACPETIRVGDLYHREATMHEGDFMVFVHCPRCWQIIDNLLERGEDFIYTLTCGIEYEAPHDDPAHALAFQTREEGQDWAKAQRGGRNR